MTMGAEGTIVCPFETKKSRNFFLISALVIINGRIFGCYLAHTNYICAPAMSLKTVQRYTKSGSFVVLALSDEVDIVARMKKIKYYYNTNTLRYEKLETPLRVTLLRVLGFLSAAIVTALILVSIAYKYFPSANEKRLMQRNDALQDNYYTLNDKVKKLQDQMGELEKRDNNVYRAIFEAAPIPDSARARENQHELEIKLVQGMDQENLYTSVAATLDQLTARIASQSKSYVQIDGFIKNKEQLLACTPAIQPVSNKDLSRIASGFGYRIDPVYKTTKFHAGLDFAAPQGTPIYATANGTVEVAGNTGNGYGNHVVINHGYGYGTLYGHMFRVKVSAGQKVKRGEIIGWVGSTGKSTGPHCHYEVHRNGDPVDPVYYFYNDITPDQYDRLLKLAASSNQSFD
jgi:murein DD-endopeptidase MepM/ murein hydrolase activator NlpD